MKFINCFALVFFGWCFTGLCFAGSGKPAQEPIEAWLKTVDKQFHPSGPSTRTEWRKTEGGSVLRLELEQAKSGQQVLEGYSLQRLENGIWGLQTHDQLVFIPLHTVNKASKKITHVKLKNQEVWRIEHLSTHMPAPPQSGISQEDSPWVSFRLRRVLKR